MDFDLDKVHGSAVEIARLGGRHTLRYFRKSLEVDRKEDNSPVTEADRSTEELMRAEIGRRFPGHGILGEEHGKVNPGHPVQWILDPIDGTKSFIHGVPLYTTLVGVLYNDEPVAGVIYAPALDELCEAAKGRGARLNGEKCRLRECEKLSEATFLTTDSTTSEEFGFGAAYRKLLDHCRIDRTWGDAYGHMLVATGRADIMFDPILSIWDAAPLLTIMREAGGIFADVEGNETIKTGNGISCSRKLLPEVLEFFK